MSLHLRERLTYLRTHKVEEAWQEGYGLAMDEADEVVEDKDAFIAQQSSIIMDCMAVFDSLHAWDQVPEELRDRLADYA